MPNEWSSIEDSSTRSLAYGARIKIMNGMHWNGMNSETKWMHSPAWHGNSVNDLSQSISWTWQFLSITRTKLKQLCSKKDSTCTCTSLPTPPTHQAYFLVLCMVLCFEFLPYVRLKKINYNEQRFFSMPNCQLSQRKQYSDTFPTGIFNRANTSSLFPPHAVRVCVFSVCLVCVFSVCLVCV